MIFIIINYYKVTVIFDVFFWKYCGAGLNLSNVWLDHDINNINNIKKKLIWNLLICITNNMQENLYKKYLHLKERLCTKAFF